MPGLSDLAAGSAASRVPSFHLRDSQRLPQAGFSKLLGHDSPDVSALLSTQKSARGACETPSCQGPGPRAADSVGLWWGPGVFSL